MVSLFKTSTPEIDSGKSLVFQTNLVYIEFKICNNNIKFLIFPTTKKIIKIV